MKHFILIMLLATSFALTSCSLGDLLLSSGSDANSNKDPNLQLWESHATEVYKIDQYITLKSFSDISFTTKLTVVNGKVDLVNFSGYIGIILDKQLNNPPPNLTYSIEDLFQLINETRFNKILNGPKVLEVNYDSVYGYPTYLCYDPSGEIDGDEIEIQTFLYELNAEKPFTYDKRKAWESLSINDYTFKQDWIDMLSTRSGIITVEENVIESGIILPDSTELTVQDARIQFRTVAGLYYMIDLAYASNTYEIMNVHFDSEMNYPDSIYFFSHTDRLLDIVTKVVD